MSISSRTIGELFPAFAGELEVLAAEAGRSDLVEQIKLLPVLTRCSCGEDNCAHFYTAAEPVGAYGTGHASVLLPSRTGLVVLDVLVDRVVAVEVLDRPDVKAPLDAYLPAG